MSNPSKTMVIVESPTKIKTISKYLGSQYVLTSTMGHIRQIPSKNNAVKWDGKQFHFSWELDSKKFSSIKKQIGNVQKILIATDPDREGEAIGWHVKTLLEEYNLPVSRITFNEITKKAVTEAIKSPREIDFNLVKAYFARLGLDYTIGFTLSPLLWLRMPLKNVSTGRVQTPTLGFIVKREIERINFKSSNYYQVEVNLSNEKYRIETVVCEYKGENVSAKLENKELAQEIYDNLPSKFLLESVDSKIITLSPPVPFITASLQQEASNLLGIKVQQVMQLAQNLYEGLEIDGNQTALITYMRTDSMAMSKDAVDSIRNFLSKNYSDFIPKEPNIFKNKAKNIQEAHECIRPVDVNITPESILNKIGEQHYKLYNLIWSRSIACQMNPAKRQQSKYIYSSTDYKLKYTNSTIKYKGYLLFYNNCIDSNEMDMKEGQIFIKESSNIHTQETKPPARFNEASLIQKMEVEGIGRPSTYTTILSTLFKREFVYEQGKQIVPTIKGALVFFFMEKYFSKFIQTDFTSYAETILDDIASGTDAHVSVIDELILQLNEGAKSIKTYVFEPVGDYLIEQYHRSCEKCKNPYQLRFKTDFFLHCKTCLINVPFFPPQEIFLDEKTKIVSYRESGLCYLVRDDKRIYLPKHFKIPEKFDYEQLIYLPKVIFQMEGEDVSAGVTQYGFFFKYKGKYYSTTLEEIKKITPEQFSEILEKGGSNKKKK